MSVRLEHKGPFAVYRFERGSTQRITLELPAIVLPLPHPEKVPEVQQSALVQRQMMEPL